MRFPGLGSWIERRAARSPSDTALIADGRARSYLDLANEARAIAELLQRNGVGRGDRVAFHGQNHPVALGSLFATAAIGAVWVPIHPARPEDEVRSVLEDSEPRVLIRASPTTHVDADVLAFEAEELEAHRAGSDAPATWEVEPDDLAILAYTSGTTGAPKGVMLTHANITWGVVQMMAACAFAPSDVTLAAAPFTRMGGLGVTVLPTLFTGGTVVVPPAAEGEAVLSTIERARVSVLFANPDLLDGMARAPGWEGADLSSIRTGVVGGGLVPEGLLRRYLDRDVKLRHGYGLTEASPVVSLVGEQEAATHAGSVGKPLPFVDVRAARPDGSACDVDEPGEWWIRGPNVTEGYWRRPPVQGRRRLVPDGGRRFDRCRRIPLLPRSGLGRDACRRSGRLPRDDRAGAVRRPGSGGRGRGGRRRPDRRGGRRGGADRPDAAPRGASFDAVAARGAERDPHGGGDPAERRRQGAPRRAPPGAQFLGRSFSMAEWA